MFDDRLIRRLLPYTSIAVIVALGYTGWVLLSRSREARASAAAAKAERAKANRKIVETYGNGHLKILSFYPSPGILKHGEKGLLCYGVANAKSVRIEPLTEQVHPSLSRCLEIAPKSDTTYTLTAQDNEGKTETQSFVLNVR